LSAPELSVVVASVNGLPYIAACLDALERHAPEAEVIVADSTDDRTRAFVAERFPDVKLLTFEQQMTVPELRAAGIFASGAPYIALIEDHCNVREGWAERMLAAQRQGHSVVGGPVNNAADRRVRDWAAFLCEYSSVMPPAPAGVVDHLPGMNVSYDRVAIAAIEDLLREGRWESWLHPRLLERGFELWSEPDAMLDHAKDFGFREFLSQRYHYSRSHAGMRNSELGWKRWVYACGSPLLVPLMYWRVVRNVRRTGRYRLELARSTPLVLLYTAVWAFGEAVGGFFGGGRSLLRVR
jgi:glycosyltransferase involved in cell wall biosynthesis